MLPWKLEVGKEVMNMNAIGGFVQLTQNVVSSRKRRGESGI